MCLSFAYILILRFICFQSERLHIKYTTEFMKTPCRNKRITLPIKMEAYAILYIYIVFQCVRLMLIIVNHLVRD